MVNIQNGVCIRDEGLNCEESTGDGVSSTVAGRLGLLRPRLMLEQPSAEQTVPISHSQLPECRRLSPGMCFPRCMGHVVDKEGRWSQ